MKIEPFVMERWQSVWENIVDYNLSESGVYPLSLQELVSKEELRELLETHLGYIQSDGTPQLKEIISRIYPDSNPQNILITSGSAEANFLATWRLVEPGDEVIFMLPNYMQIRGLVRAFGGKVRPFYLKEELSWGPDLEELKKKVTKKTKIILVTNPNNPTGSVLNEEARETILELARWAKAWLVSDEVYQGAEYGEETTPTLWGAYEKVIVTCGLSKAYGLPGLRVGWMVAPPEFIEKVWAYKDYTTISISALSDRLARIALSPENRQKILERTRKIIRTNYPLFESWLKRQNGIFECIPPKAGAIVFPRYNLKINSTELVEKIRERKSVLLAAGDHFELDFHLRFGVGEEKDRFLKALELVEECLKEICSP